MAQPPKESSQDEEAEKVFKEPAPDEDLEDWEAAVVALPVPRTPFAIVGVLVEEEKRGVGDNE